MDLSPSKGALARELCAAEVTRDTMMRVPAADSTIANVSRIEQKQSKELLCGSGSLIRISSRPSPIVVASTARLSKDLVRELEVIQRLHRDRRIRRRLIEPDPLKTDVVA